MQIVMNFLFNGVEYMIYKVSGYMPGPAGIELLCNRKYGIGADRMLVYTDAQNQPSFRVFSSAGEETAADEQDFLIFMHYLREQNIPGNMAEFAKALGDQALVKAGHVGENAALTEVHVTDAFCDRIRESDRKNNTRVC